MILRLPLSAPSDGSRLLKSARMISASGVPAAKNAFYKFRFGVMRGATFTAVAAFDGTKNVLEPGVPYPLTGSMNLARPLADGDVLALEAERFGVPPPLFDTAIEWTTTFRTALAGADFDPRLGEFFARSGVLDRPETRSLGVVFAMDSVERKRVYTTTDKTFVAGAGVSASDVAITFTKPSWARIGAFSVTAVVSYNGTTGFTTLSIFDGTTDNNTIAYSYVSGSAMCGVTGHTGEIVDTTTLTLRGSATTNNVTWQESLIYGTCAWT